MFGPAVGAGKRICHKTGNRGDENNSAFPSLYHPCHKSMCQKNRSKGVHLKLMTEIVLRHVSNRSAFSDRCVMDQYTDAPLPCLGPVFGISYIQLLYLLRHTAVSCFLVQVRALGHDFLSCYD